MSIVSEKHFRVADLAALWGFSSAALQLDAAALYGSGASNQPKGIRNQTGVTVTDLGTNGYSLVDYSKFNTSDAFVGQFDQCMIGIRTGMVMEISRVAADSTGSAFSAAQVWIRAYLRADVQLSHSAAFVVLNGIL